MMVRAFAERDRDAVVELSLRAWAPVFASLEGVLGESGVYDRMHPDWGVDQARTVREACGAEGMHTWVAELDGTVAGFVTARLDQAERMGEVYLIAVDPAHQGKGVGAQLTSFVLRWFKDKGMALAMVETGGDPGHAQARRTYEQAGFVQLPIARYFKAL